MPEGLAYPFDRHGAPDGFRMADSGRSCSTEHGVVAGTEECERPARARSDAAVLNLLLDVVAALEPGWPAVSDSLRKHRAEPEDFPMTFEAPFGIGGPALLEFGDLRMLLFDRAMVQSVMSVIDPVRLLLGYTRVMTGFLLLHPAPRRVELIGLGGGSLFKYCRRHLPETEIVAVERDTRVVSLRDRFAIPADDGRCRVVHRDGTEFVRDDPGRPDVILVDGVDGSRQAQRLASVRFYEDCRNRLSGGGVLVVNLCDNLLARRTAIKRIGRVFAHEVVVVPIEGQQNRIVFASSGAGFERDAARLPKAAEALGIRDGVDFPALAQRIIRRM